MEHAVGNEAEKKADAAYFPFAVFRFQMPVQV